MKGNNSFILCQATMIEALRDYLNAQFEGGSEPTVTSVKQLPDNTFEIKTTDQKENANA